MLIIPCNKSLFILYFPLFKSLMRINVMTCEKPYIIRTRNTVKNINWWRKLGYITSNIRKLAQINFIATFNLRNIIKEDTWHSCISLSSWTFRDKGWLYNKLSLYIFTSEQILRNTLNIVTLKLWDFDRKKNKIIHPNIQNMQFNKLWV